MGSSADWLLADLPGPARTQVVRWTAEVLPQVRPLPGPLRRVADFAPARRAVAGRAALESALANPAFREAVAVQVAAQTDLDADSDAAEVAAAWLHRPEGWEETISALSGALAAGELVAPEDELQDLRAQVAALEENGRVMREEHRARLAEIRAENARLRQRLGEARARAREAEGRAEAAEQAGAQVQAESDREKAVLTRELRQARRKVEELETERQAGKNHHRTAKVEAAVRTRLLLETLEDAVVGLRRELALPPTAHVPADVVDAVLPRDVSAEDLGSRGEEGPEALEHLLALPRVRLLVDGYNVAKAAWPTATLELQRIRLVTLLGALAARTGAETTVVFDAQHSAHRAPTPVPRGMKVVFSPAGVIADDVIVDYVRAEPTGRVVLVVTDDRGLAARVRSEGAKAVHSSALVALLAR